MWYSTRKARIDAPSNILVLSTSRHSARTYLRKMYHKVQHTYFNHDTTNPASHYWNLCAHLQPPVPANHSQDPDAALKRDFCQPPLGSLLRLGLAQSGQQYNNLVPFVILCLVSFSPALVFASFGTISQILCLLLVALLLLDISARHNEFRKTSQKKTPLILSIAQIGGREKGGRPCLH